MKLTKITALLLAVFMMAILAASCQKNNDNTTTTTPSSKVTQKDEPHETAKYDVIYQKADGTTGFTQTVEENAEITLKEGEQIAGKTFKGWKESSDAEGTILPEGTKVKVTKSLTYIHVYEDNAPVDPITYEKNISLAKGAAKIFYLDVSSINASSPVTLTFDFAHDGMANGGLGKCAVFSINGKSTIRVTGGGALHTDPYAGTQGNHITTNWGAGNGGKCYQGQDFPNTKITVTVTVDIAKDSVSFSWSDLGAEKSCTLTGFGLSETMGKLSLQFGDMNTNAIEIADLNITYNAK